MIAALSGDPYILNMTPSKINLNSARSKEAPTQAGAAGTAEERDLEDPFQRRPKLQRSPGNASTNGMEQMQLIDRKNAASESTPGRESFHNLGEQIRKLVEMLEENGGKRRSIHQPMRDAIESIKALYELSAIQLQDERAKEVIRTSSASQTTPGLIKIKRKQAFNDVTPEARQEAKKRRPVLEAQAPKTPTSEAIELDSPWRKVVRKGGKKTIKEVLKEAAKEPKKMEKKAHPQKKAKPDAIVIVAKEGKSYADILRSFKANPTMADIGAAVSRIRRTQNGNMLLQLNDKESRTAEFQGRISEVVGQEAEVRLMSHRVEVRIKDIDEITTKEEVSAAIQAQFQEEIPLENIILRQAYGKTQTAILRMQQKGATKLLKAGRIKIGWVVCRIRERTTLTRCFKCLEYGHLARVCKSTEDRSKLCRKCGVEGHIARLCDREPRCMFCAKDHPNNANHIAGSSTCPVLRRAVATK